MQDLVYSFELADDDAARERARELADRTGKDVVVKDERGRELFRVKPTAGSSRTVN